LHGASFVANAGGEQPRNSTRLKESVRVPIVDDVHDARAIDQQEEGA